MMEITGRDLTFSVGLHIGLIMLVLLLNPFTIALHPKMDAIAVNIITMPPLGNPDLLKNKTKEIIIPKPAGEDQAAVPLKTPESAVKKDKKKEPAKPIRHTDTGYKGIANQQEGTSASDLAGPGTAFGTVLVDNAGFDYPYFFVQAFGKIQQNWSNPVAANQALSCIIYFQVMRTGTVLDSKIEKTSGVAAFDRACLRAVQVSSPLPPLPADFGEDIIGIHLEFPYQPN